MEEKILLQSKHHSKASIAVFFLVAFLVVLIVFEVAMLWAVIAPRKAETSHRYDVNYRDRYSTYLEHRAKGKCPNENYGNLCWSCESYVAYYQPFSDKTEYVRYNLWDMEYECSFLGLKQTVDGPVGIVLWGILPGILLGTPLLLLLFLFKGYSMTVTDKRVYGKVVFGKRVDIPLDSVSSVATLRLLKGVSVASSSGKISFLFIKNAGEMYDQINALLVDRQGKESKTVEIKTEIAQSNADELKKFKELLDCGIITQEEFDAKKKQLLGL